RHRAPHRLPSFPTRRSSDLGSGPPIVLVHGLGGSHRNWIGEQTSLDSGNGRESEGANDGMASLGTVAASTAASPSPREKAIRDLDRKSTRLNSSHDQISYAV